MSPTDGGDLGARTAADDVGVTETSLLIRINRLFRPGLSEHALYEATLGV